MKISCIGWGSLIWKPDRLKIQNKWFEDGPLLPIEFTRISCDDRVTLIIDEKANPVRTIWALMKVKNLDEAIESLKERERTSKKRIHHVLSSDNPTEEIKKTIRFWLKEKELDAAIWTGLSYSKKTQNIRPNIDTIIDHLKNIIDYKTQKVAEEYIRKAPIQIDTEYRRVIERELGWTPIE